MPENCLEGRRLLVVEDEYLLAEDIRLTLERFGAEVFGPIPTVGEAMAAICDFPDLDGAVLDMNLRGNMVYPVADLLRARGVPFVFATGHGPDGMPDRFADVLRLQKPFDVDHLARALARGNKALA